MPGPVNRQTLGFSSSDGRSQIKGLLWQPAGTTASSPRGIVQIVHGMAEYVGRYENFARYLASAGYVVCGHDHIGHGKSVSDPGEWGHMPVAGGKDILINDVDQLRKLVSARFARSVPYFMFGHSMGSLVVRVYLTSHAEGLSGAVVCATANRPVFMSEAGNYLARAIARRKGERTVSPLMHSLVDGAFAKAVSDARTEFDWLTADEGNVDAYIADEQCGFPFTVGGYATLTELSAQAARLDQAALVPRELPMLFISGALDPVGDNGEGVRAAADLMSHAGIRDVTVTLYEGMRHEILNEAERERVYADVLAWLEQHR